MEELTPDEVQGIAAEINHWNRHYPAEDKAGWAIHAIAHLDLPTEAYEVVYANRCSDIFFRNEQGHLEPAERKTYFAPEWKMKGYTI